MSLPLRLASIAEVDIAEIAEFLSQRQSDVAPRFMDAVDHTFDLIRQFPFVGATVGGNRIKSRELRAFRVQDFKSYVIYYIAANGEVQVVRVLHSSRLPEF